MQALNTLGRRPNEQSAKVAEVWRTIIGSCSLGDTLVLDFVVPTGQGGTTSKNTKLATFSGSVSAVVDRSKRTPKVMFRAEGFREQIQLPPTTSSEHGGHRLAPGSDAASLVEFLTSSKLVGASVLRKERDSSAAKTVLCIGSRSKQSVQPRVALDVPQEKPATEMPPVEPELRSELADSTVALPDTKGTANDDLGGGGEGAVGDSEHPFFLLTTEQKRLQFGELFERVYVDEPTSVHLGATLLLSMLANSTTDGLKAAPAREKSQGLDHEAASSSRFHSFYSVGSRASQKKSAAPSADSHEQVAPRVYEEEHEEHPTSSEASAVPGSSVSHTSGDGKSNSCAGRCEWEMVGSGAFASVYKVSTEGSTAAVKMVRGLLHTSEESADETQLTLFQKIASELRAQLVPEHIDACPSVVKALSLPAKAAMGLSAPLLGALKSHVGMGAPKDVKAGHQDVNGLDLLQTDSTQIPHDTLNSRLLKGDSQWYARAHSSQGRHLDCGLEVLDVIHMQDESDANSASGARKGPRSSPPGRISFFPFSKEVELLVEWRELMEGELQKCHPNPHEAAKLRRQRDRTEGDDSPMNRKLRRAHAQHCYSFLLGARSKGSCVRSLLSLETNRSGSALGKSATLSVADIFASRKLSDPAATCGMTIQKPPLSPCRLGFTSGAMGIRQSSVGELMNLQLCTGKEHVVSLNDWGYRGARLGQFLELSLSFLIDMAENTHVGKSELLDWSALTAVTSLFGGRRTALRNLSATPPHYQSNVFVANLAARHFRDAPPRSRNIPFSLQDALFPSLSHLFACSQAHLSCFGLSSLLEGSAGIVMPFCDQPLNRLQRRIGGFVSERKGLADMVNSEFKERLAVLKKMAAHLSATDASFLPTHSLENLFGYDLQEEDTQFWIKQLPRLDALYASIYSSVSRPLSSNGSVHECLEDGAARYILPPRFSDRTERLSLAIAVLRDLVPALESLHSTDVVHRDVKPNNIMVIRQLSFDAPYSEDVSDVLSNGSQPVPRLLYEFLGEPQSLLERNRCGFELIDLGWGRVLPSATVDLPPFPDAPKEMSVPADGAAPEGSGSDSDDDEHLQMRRRGMMASPGERRYEDDVVQRAAKPSGVVPAGNSLPLLPALLPTLAPVRPTMINPMGQMTALAPWAPVETGHKRDRDMHGHDSYALPVIPTMPFGMPTTPSQGLSYSLPNPNALPIQHVDPRLFSMQRKVASFQRDPSISGLPPLPLPSVPFSLAGIVAKPLPSLSFSQKPLPMIANTLLPLGNNLQRPEPSSFAAEGKDDEDENYLEVDDIGRDFLLSGPAGNMCYRAPEFLLGPREQVLIPGATGPDGPRYAYTPSIDVFALGTVLFELLTGTRFLKVRPQELEHQDLRNGHLLQRMVESLGYPKVWVAEVVVRLRGVRPTSFPNLILQSPYALSRIRSTSASRVAQKCLDQLEGFFLADSIRRNRILDAPNLEAAIAYAWEEVVIGTTGASKMHSISDPSGSTGIEVFCEADNDVTGSKDSIMRSMAMPGAAGKIRPYCIVPVRLLGQHGYGGIVYQHQESSESSTRLNRPTLASQQGPQKRPPTSVFILKCLQQQLRSVWAYEPRTASKMGFKGFSEIEQERATALSRSSSSFTEARRGTFSGSIVPESLNSPAEQQKPSDMDRVYEMVGLVSRMLAWEPSERPSLRDVMSSGCFSLLCGGDRGYFDL